jgi:hypothetical protein
LLDDTHSIGIGFGDLILCIIRSILNMRKELDEALVRDFPLCFARDADGREPWSMFGFECNDGWEPSIRKAAEKLEPLLREAKENDPEGYKFSYYRTSQLKEKYGTGRWYLSGGTDKMHDIVKNWESETETICEICGKPGELRGGGWLYTACKEHTKEEDLDPVLGVLEIKENKNG